MRDPARPGRGRAEPAHGRGDAAHAGGRAGGLFAARELARVGFLHDAVGDAVYAARDRIGDEIYAGLVRLHTTTERTPLIEKFQSGAVPLFLISLKAGGTGLNLTAADTVIHYDPWWNPAVEAQATDRAHRIGQTKPVFVYKLIAQGTVEERIVSLQERKHALASQLYTDKNAAPLQLDAADLEMLFAP